MIDRCNLTILKRARRRRTSPSSSPRSSVEIVASLPCYLEDNVDRQRGNGVFEASMRGLQQLNALGYGREGSAPRRSISSTTRRAVPAAARRQ